MKKKLLFITLLLPLTGFGQLVSWTFNNQTTSAILVPGIESATATAVGVDDGGFVNDAYGENDCSLADFDYVWRTTNWPVGTQNNSNISLDRYLEFRLTTMTDASLLISGIYFSVDRSDGQAVDGPKAYEVRSSADNYTNILGSSNNFRGNTCSLLNDDVLFFFSIVNGADIAFRIYFGDAQGPEGELFIDDVWIIGTVLPVTLTSFSGTPGTDGVQLQWTTATELNNERFIVERSRYGEGFEAIGAVRGYGTTEQPQQYQFLDRQPFPGTNYYRLKQVDYDGAHAYLPVIAVDFSDRGSPEVRPDLRLSPNPVREELHITGQLAEKGKGARLQILDLTGRQLGDYRAGGTDGSFTLAVDDLPAGWYLLRITQNGSSQSLRFIKQ